MGRKARRNAEEIIKIIREVDGGMPEAEACRKHAVSTVTLNRWRKQYGGMGLEDAKRLKELDKENTKLLRLVGNQALIIEEFKKLLKKTGLEC